MDYFILFFFPPETTSVHIQTFHRPTPMEIGSKGALARVEATAVRDGIGTPTRAKKKRTTGEEIEGVVLSEIMEVRFTSPFTYLSDRNKCIPIHRVTPRKAHCSQLEKSL